MGAGAPSLWLALAGLITAGMLGFLAHGWWDQRPGGLVSQLADARAQLAGDAAQEAAAAAHAAAVTKHQADASTAASEAQAVTQTRIVTVTRTLTREIPDAISPQVDRDYPVPVGFLRVHDAAARGLDLSEVPDPAGRPADAASGVATSAAAAAIVANYGACRADDAQLAGLQAWLTAQAAAAAASPQ